MTTQAASSDESESVLAAAGELPVAREQRLWGEEVAQLLGAGTSLEPAARGAVLAVLASLADDPTESAQTRRDVRALLVALGTGATPDGVLCDERFARAGFRRDGHPSAGLRGVVVPAG